MHGVYLPQENLIHGVRRKGRKQMRRCVTTSIITSIHILNNLQEDAWGVPAPGEYDPWAVPETQLDTEDTAVKSPGGTKSQRDKKPAGDKKSQRDRPPKDRKPPGEKKGASDNAAESPGTPSAETPTSPTEGDERKKTFAYNNPERVRTGGAQRVNTAPSPLVTNIHFYGTGQID